MRVDHSGNYCLFPETDAILDSIASQARQGIIGNAERTGFPWLPMTESDNPARHSGPERGTKPGYIQDYVSGVEVRATPEELEAVQVFSRRLVEDYDYEREQLQTRPQFRVRKRPSDEERSFPVDAAFDQNVLKGATPSAGLVTLASELAGRRGQERHIQGPIVRLGGTREHQESRQEP